MKNVFHCCSRCRENEEWNLCIAEEIVSVKLVMLLPVFGWHLVRLMLTLLRGGAAHVAETSGAAGWLEMLTWLMVDVEELRLHTVESSGGETGHDWIFYCCSRCCRCDCSLSVGTWKNKAAISRKREGVDIAWLLDVNNAEKTLLLLTDDRGKSWLD